MYEHSCIESSRWPVKAVERTVTSVIEAYTNRRQANMACSGAVEVRPFQAKKKQMRLLRQKGSQVKL